MYLTTSWDDGHILDNRLSKLLDKYNIKGTFFLCKSYLSEQLKEKDIQGISKNHEIGAHTINHPHLSTLNFTKQYDEISRSKKWLEDILGESCDGFCYPSGNYNLDSIRAVNEAGFLYARTVQTNVFEFNKDNLFELPTTLQIYSYPFRKKNKNKYLYSDLFRPIINNKNLKKSIGVSGLVKLSWSSMASNLLDYAIKDNRQVFHIWGHSWEIEKYNLWSELELFFNYVAKCQNVEFVTNKELVKKIMK